MWILYCVYICKQNQLRTCFRNFSIQHRAKLSTRRHSVLHVVSERGRDFGCLDYMCVSLAKQNRIVDEKVNEHGLQYISKCIWRTYQLGENWDNKSHNVNTNGGVALRSVYWFDRTVQTIWLNVSPGTVSFGPTYFTFLDFLLAELR